MVTRHSPPRAPAGLAQMLQQAVAAHQSGHLDQAESLYVQILQQQPRHFDALHLRGVLALQQGRLDEAETLIRAALEVNPKEPNCLSNLGTVLLRAGRLEEALTVLERALKFAPGHGDVQLNLGTVLHRLGRPTAALVPLKRVYAAARPPASVYALYGDCLLDSGDVRAAVSVFEAGTRRAPGDAQAWTNLSIAALRAGQAASAMTAAEKALELDPSRIDAQGQRGLALAALNRRDEAQRLLRSLAERHPGDAAVWNNLGAFLRDIGDAASAIAALERACALSPDLDAARENLIAALTDVGRGADAVQAAQRLVSDRPESASSLAALAAAEFEQGRVEDALAIWVRASTAQGVSADTLLGYGNALMAVGNAVEAQRVYKRGIDRDPEHAKLRWAHAMAMLRPIVDDAKEHVDGVRQFAKAIAELDSWITPGRVVAAAAAVGSTQPFYLAYHPQDGVAALSAYGRLCARVSAAAHVRPAAAKPAATAGRKTRVGIVSAQVRNHSVWNAITRGWVEKLDPTRFELHLFHLGRQRDAETAWAVGRVARLIERAGSDEAWAEVIRQAACDVLIYPEISMDPLTARLASQRLAPVQAASWGHPQTSGLPTMDLYLSADAMEPEDAAVHYSERLMRLPGLGVHVAPLRPVALAPDLAALGLPEGEPLLLCPGTPFKYGPESDEVWARMAAELAARGRGRLVFFKSHRAAMNERLERRLRLACGRMGPSAVNRLAFIPALERSRFFGLLQRSTLMLDTVNFSGFNTALQAIECGLPVVAWEGDFLRGRLASGPLRLMGLDDCIASDLAGFVEAAMRLVDDPTHRNDVRARIAARSGLLFCDEAPVRALEAGLVEAVERVHAI